jgi:hypothetical protein
MDFFLQHCDAQGHRHRKTKLRCRKQKNPPPGGFEHTPTAIEIAVGVISLSAVRWGTPSPSVNDSKRPFRCQSNAAPTPLFVGTGEIASLRIDPDYSCSPKRYAGTSGAISSSGAVSCQNAEEGRESAFPHDGRGVTARSSQWPTAVDGNFAATLLSPSG